MKIGLCISGGANKGSWAEGVVTAISEHHSEGFSLIAGTSIGGVVGACHAAGLPRETRWEWWERMSWGQITNPGMPPGICGLVGSSFFINDKMKKLFRKIFPATFEELKTPLVLTACNLMAGLFDDANVLNSSGDLIQALLATVAIPGIFPPVKIGDKLLVDGGIGNYIPLSIFKDFDRVYAVLCGYGTPPERPKTAIEIISRSFEMGVQEEIIRELGLFDSNGNKLIAIINRHSEITQSSMMDWLHGKEWLELGYSDGKEAINKVAGL